MTRSEFWTQLELNPFLIAYETHDYLVIVTPRAWREQARSETDRNLQEFCLVHKTYHTVEGSANNLLTALLSVKQLQDGLDQMEEKEKPSAHIVRFPSKDDPS